MCSFHRSPQTKIIIRAALVLLSYRHIISPRDLLQTEVYVRTSIYALEATSNKSCV